MCSNRTEERCRQPDDPRKNLDQALEPRRRLARWPAALRFYRLADVRPMLTGLDALLPDLARVAGATLPAARAWPDPPRYEPEPPLPGPNDWVAFALAAAAASSDDNGRTAILRNALAVAGAAESAAPIRAELVRLGVPVPPAAAAAAPPPAPAPAPAKTSEPLPPKTSVPAPVIPVAVTPPPAPPPDPAPTSEPVPVPAPAAAVVAQAVAPVAPAADSSSLRRTLMMVTIAVGVLGAAAGFVLRRRPSLAAREPAIEAPPSEVPAPVVLAPVVSAPAVSAPVVTAPVVTAPVVPAPVASASPPVRPPALTPAERPASPGPQPLELVRVSDNHDHGYSAVEGEVKNVSSQVLADLAVAIRWYIPQGAFLTSDEAFIGAEALPAGRTLAFRILTRSLPGMASYSLEFRSAGHLVAEFRTINP